MLIETFPLSMPVAEEVFRSLRVALGCVGSTQVQPGLLWPARAPPPTPGLPAGPCRYEELSERL